MAEDPTRVGAGERSPGDGTGIDYGRLMKRVAQVAEEIERAPDVGVTVHSVVDTVISQFRDQLGIYGGRLYRREGSAFVLQATFGDAKRLPRGLRIPISYPPFRDLLEQRTLYMEPNDPRLDRELESRLGVATFAAIEVADQKYVLAFDLAPGARRDEVLYSLGILRYAINQKVQRERMEGALRQAQRIQASILPRRMPDFGPFDIHARTRPLEIVGGDFFDFIPITEKILGLCIADVSGHGLAAALQVRDIHMGLRMGLSRDLKIVRTVERLNSIIHHSTLTSRFVSLFYGELEPSGAFMFVNAGHPAPFVLRADGSHRWLEEGGAVLGPVADGSYERGFVVLDPGDLLVLYTDGVTEACAGEGSEGEAEFGSERLVAAARSARRARAAAITAAIFDRVDEHCGGQAPRDDRTVVVVRRPEVGASRAARGGRSPASA